MSTRIVYEPVTDTELTRQHAGDHDFKLIERMVLEIRARRLADLSNEDIATLKVWRDGLVYEHGRMAVESLTAVLDKLLAKAG